VRGVVAGAGLGACVAVTERPAGGGRKTDAPADFTAGGCAERDSVANAGPGLGAVAGAGRDDAGLGRKTGYWADLDLGTGAGAGSRTELKVSWLGSIIRGWCRHDLDEPPLRFRQSVQQS